MKKYIFAALSMFLLLLLISCTPKSESTEDDSKQIEEELAKLPDPELDQIIAEGSEGALTGQAGREPLSKASGISGKFYKSLSQEKKAAASRWSTKEVWESAKKVKEFKGLCGNGKLDVFGKITEECDDGGKQDGDGCSSQCTVEDNWNCDGEPSSCMKCVDVPGVLGWWPGDKNGEDLKSKNPGALEKGAGVKEGKVSNAFVFSAEGDGVLVNAGEPGISDFDFMGEEDDFTIEAWIKTSKGGVIVSKLGHSDPKYKYYTGFELSVTPSGGIKVLFASAGGSSIEKKLETGTGGIDVSDDKWHHVAVLFKHKEVAAGYCPTVGPENLKVYIDGVLSSGNPEGYACIDLRNDASMRIGGRTGLESSASFSGLVDEVTIYERMLSESEIKSLYLAGSAGKCK